MAAGPEPLVRYIRRLVISSESGEATDAALLGRFISERDETAFAALVDRHGPLVLHVCRRVLGNVHDAEDAFQAAFLVLARKAATVYPREALTAWLHVVAHRAALKVRSAKVRQRRVAQPLAVPPADTRSDPLAELSARELLVLVDEEVRRLPEVYRLPVILCCLEGRSLEEAARQLGWTLGSVKGRLERGRARLHGRLVRRGLTLSAALAAAELSRGAGSAAVVARLIAPTIQAAMGFAAGQPALEGVSAQAVVLAGEGVKGMAVSRLKLPATLLLATSLLAAGFVAHRAADSPRTAPEVRFPFPSRDKGGLAAPQAIAQNETRAAPEDATRRIEVRGRVLDPAGRPFAGARLYVGYAPRPHEVVATADRPDYPLRATSGRDGRFRFAFVRSELDERYLDASRPVVVAVAGGFGLAWAEIGEPAGTTLLSLRLVEDLPLEGCILDQDRNPVAGAKVRVLDVSGSSAEGLTRFLHSGDRRSGAFRSCRGPLPGQSASVTTAADGRFRLRGMGRDRLVTLVLEGPAIPCADLAVAMRSPAAIPSSLGVQGATFDYVALPPRSIRGRVRDKATGRPVAGVKLKVLTTGSTTLTDKEGRYELTGSSGFSEIVLAEPQRGQPYVVAAARLPEKPGPAPLTADLDLVRGIPLQGRVTDQATGKPPRRAVVEYYPLFPNAHSAALTDCPETAPVSSAPVQPDGSYHLTVLPGCGVVLVAVSPRDSYASAPLEDKELANHLTDWKGNHGRGSLIRIAVGTRGIGRGEWWLGLGRYNALSLIKPDERAESLALDFTVQPARRLRGTVVGPDGKPLLGVRVNGLTSWPDAETLESASFAVEGLNPRHARQLSFHHREKGLGKVVTLRGDQTEPVTVHLEPCGWITGRLVDKAGKPAPGVMVGLFCPNHGTGVTSVQTDREGRFRMGMVAGQPCALESLRPLLGAVATVEVESGGSKDLGDLPVGERTQAGQTRSSR